MRLLTVASASYVPFAEVMFESAKRLHPELRPTLLVPDVTKSGLQRLAEQGVAEFADLLCVEDLGFDFLESARSYYDALEFSSSLKVLGTAHILKSESECLFLDPDMLLLDRIDSILGATEPVIVTPHAMSPMPQDGSRPDDLEMCSAGIINGGVLRVKQGAPALEWLVSQTRSRWFVAPHLGMYADQLWLTSMPFVFPESRVLQDPAVNVAYWNLHERPLRRDEGRVVLESGAPVALFHFSGFSVPSNGRLTTHSTRRYDAETEAVIVEIVQRYEQRLRQARLRWKELKGDIPFCRDRQPTRLARAARLLNDPRLAPLPETGLKGRIRSVLGI